jgi:hypothetical protein
MDDHKFFTKLNDAILLNFESFTLWERAFLSEMLQKVVHKQAVSKKQKSLVEKIIIKRQKKKK